MKVSVVIPTCDRPEYLERAVASVFNQNYQPIEVLIIDNGNEPILSERLSNYSNLAIYWIGARVGVSKARNFGIQKSTGDVVCFLMMMISGQKTISTL